MIFCIYNMCKNMVFVQTRGLGLKVGKFSRCEYLFERKSFQVQWRFMFSQNKKTIMRNIWSLCRISVLIQKIVSYIGNQKCYIYVRQFSNMNCSIVVIYRPKLIIANENTNVLHSLKPKICDLVLISLSQKYDQKRGIVGYIWCPLNG